jgi:uncharacterized protein YbjT (DUF2867 family)
MSRPIILVASGTANTGASVVKYLSALNTVDIRAMTRDPTAEKVKALAAMPNVTVVKGDFDDQDSVVAALKGVSRTLLVSDAFSHNHFEREAFFMKEADKTVEATVRISTCSMLIRPGTTGAYGRAHHGLQAYADDHKLKVIHMNPNWFFSNWFMQAAEIKSAGTISYPVSAKGEKTAMVNPDDIGSACAHILTLPLDKLQPLLALKNVEIHGPALVNFEDVEAALTKSLGYDIKVNTVPAAAWAQGLMSMGIPRVFANSFLETVQMANEPTKYMTAGPISQETSKELFASGWNSQTTLEDWANSPLVKGVLGRE